MSTSTLTARKTPPHVDAGRAYGHVLLLLAVDGATTDLVAAVVGATHASTIAKLAAGTREQVLRRTAERILATPASEVRRVLSAVRATRSLVAQGWGIARQAKMMPCGPVWLARVVSGGANVTRDQEAAIWALVARVDSGWPRRTWGPDAEEAAQARQNGWFPLACYDDETGELLPDAIRNDYRDIIADARRMWGEISEPTPRSIASANQAARAVRYVTILRRSLLNGWSAPQIAVDLKISTRSVRRLWRAAGLTFTFDPTTGLTPRLGVMPRAIEIRDAICDANANPTSLLHSLGISVDQRNPGDAATARARAA